MSKDTYPAAHEAEPATPQSVLQDVITFTNGLSKELADTKAAMAALIHGELVTSTSIVEEDGGEKITFDRAYGRVEGFENALNALAAFTITKGSELTGSLTPDSAQES